MGNGKGNDRQVIHGGQTTEATASAEVDDSEKDDDPAGPHTGLTFERAIGDSPPAGQSPGTTATAKLDQAGPAPVKADLPIVTIDNKTLNRDAAALPETVELDLRLIPDINLDSIALNPAVEEWNRLGQPITPDFFNTRYIRALDEQGLAAKAIEKLHPEDRRRWRDFQIDLSATKDPLEAARIRHARDQAFPEIATHLDNARTQYDAGRHVEINGKLIQALPSEKSKNEFKMFLLTADLETKEALAQWFQQPGNAGFSRFGHQRNSMNYYDSSSIGSRALFGDRQGVSTRLYPSPAAGAGSLRLYGDAVTPRLNTETTFSDPGKTPLVIDPLLPNDSTTLRPGEKPLTIRNGGIEFNPQAVSPREYAQRLTQQSELPTDRFQLFPDRRDFSSPMIRPFNQNPLGAIFDNSFFRTDVRLSEHRELENPIKSSAWKALQELDKPGDAALLSMKAERLGERLAQEIDQRKDLKEHVTDPESIKRNIGKLEASPKATTSQKIDFLNSLERLIDPKIKGVAPPNDRLVLAGQLLDQSVDIGTIDQGNFKTCAMGVVEKLMYTRNLDEVGRMITDVALTGKTKTDAGKTVELESQWVLGGPEGRRMVPPTDGVRSLASHYFALIGANVRFQQYNAENGTKYKYAHEGGRDVLKDYATNPPSDVYQHFQTGALLTQKDGKNPPAGYFAVCDPQIMNATILLDVYENLSGQSAAGMAIRASQPYRGDARMIEFANPQELRGQLAKRSAREFPVILVQPGHVSTIDGFDAKSGLADYDNQWGDKNDRIGANGIDTNALWKISLGQYPFELSHTMVAGDRVEGRLNPKMVGISDEQLTTTLLKHVSDRKFSDACDVAQELKVRADLILDSSDRVDSRQAILTLHDYLRTGSRSKAGVPSDTKLTERERLMFHSAIVGDLNAMTKQIDTRTTLSTVLQAAGRHKDAETALIEAKKLADELPLEVILAQREQIKLDAASATNAEGKAWLEAQEKALGDPREGDSAKMAGIINQPIYTRMKLMQLYLGYEITGSHVGEVFKPDKAAAVAEDLRKSTFQKMGFEPPNIAQAKLEPGTGEQPLVSDSTISIGPDPQSELAKQLDEVDRVNQELNVKTLRAKLKANPDDTTLKQFLLKAEAQIENQTSS